MKTIFTIIIGTILSLTICAGSTNYTNSQYLISQGIDTVNKVQIESVTCTQSNDKDSDTQKKNEIIEVNTKTELDIDQTDSPNFLKLFFNFI